MAKGMFVLSDEQVRRLAELAHEAYLRDAGESITGQRAEVSWGALVEADRQQNIEQIWHTVKKNLPSVGLEVLPLEDGGSPATELVTADDVERMAMAEHGRWVELKLDQGYIYGEDRQDEPPTGSPRTHPDLLEWDDLEEPVRDKDRDAIRAFLGHLGMVGLGLRRVRATARPGARRSGHIFVSHSTRDEARAAEVAGRLRELGYSVFFNAEEPHGAGHHHDWLDALDQVFAFVVVVSDHALGSTNVLDEVRAAKARFEDDSMEFLLAVLPADGDEHRDRLMREVARKLDFQRFQVVSIEDCVALLDRMVPGTG